MLSLGDRITCKFTTEKMSGFPEQVNLILKGKVEALEIKSIRHRTLMANYFVIDLVSKIFKYLVY